MHKNTTLYSRLSDVQLGELMKKKLLTSPKSTIEKNERIFSLMIENVIKNEIYTQKISIK